MTSPSPFATPEPWELVANGYAAEVNLVMRGFSLRAFELVAPGPDAVVLDVAAGPGTLALEIAARVRRVDAVDFSPRMIELLSQAARAASLANVRASVADGQALPFADAAYDAAFSLFGLMFFPDRARGYAELLRVLKPGARALVSSWAPLEASPLMTAMFGAIAAVDPNFVAPKKNLESLENADVLAREMRDAGFVGVRIEGHSESVRPASAVELWERMTRSSAPLVLLRKRLGEEEWKRRSQGAFEFLERHLAEVPELSTSAWLGIGAKPS